jgi:hypothetical protein
MIRMVHNCLVAPANMSRMNCESPPYTVFDQSRYVLVRSANAAFVGPYHSHVLGRAVGVERAR